MESVIAVNVDGQCAAWAKMDSPLRAGDTGEGDVAGGVLTGDHLLVERIREELANATVIRVAHPDHYYTMSDGRGSPADVAAAMIAAGRGRALLSDSGWDALEKMLDFDEEVAGYDGESAEVVH